MDPSVNRSVAPDDSGSTPPPAGPAQPAQMHAGSIAARAMKVPPAMVIAGLEAMLRILRGVQSLYDSAIDGVLPGPAPMPSHRLQGAQVDVVRDTLSALVAFVVPGPDAYSVAQGESTPEQGGVDAGILGLLIETLNRLQPLPPDGPTPSAAVAGVLNQIALQVNASIGGPSGSPFARLSFGDKARVFQAIEANPQTRPLVGVLPLTAYLVYSEGAAFDRERRIIRGRPVGWALCGYDGVADGRDEFKGYYQDRRSAESTAENNLILDS